MQKKKKITKNRRVDLPFKSYFFVFTDIFIYMFMLCIFSLQTSNWMGKGKHKTTLISCIRASFLYSLHYLSQHVEDGRMRHEVLASVRSFPFLSFDPYFLKFVSSFILVLCSHKLWLHRHQLLKREKVKKLAVLYWCSQKTLGLLHVTHLWYFNTT